MKKKIINDSIPDKESRKTLTITMDITTDDLVKLSKIFIADDKTEEAKQCIIEQVSDSSLNESLMQKNKLINFCIVFHGRPVSITAEWIYNFIKEHFVQKLKASYEWFALYKFLKDNGYLMYPESRKFAKQMNVWFAGLTPKFGPTIIYRYSFLSSYPVESWPDISEDKLKSNIKLGAVRRIYVVYTELVKAHDALLA